MQVLQFIKTHWVLLLCGLVALGAIGGAVLGMSSDEVVKEMNAEISRTGAGGIRGLQSKPKNEEIIAKEKRRGELFEEEYVKTVEEAKRINKREVLMDGVFPKEEKTATPYEFKQKYAKTMRVLYAQLNAGTLPTEAEIQEEAQNVEDLLLLEAEQKAEEEEDEAGRAPRAPGGGRLTAPRANPMVGGGGGRTMPGGGGRMMPSGAGRMMPGRMGGFVGPGGPGVGRIPQVSAARSGEPKYDAVYRAQVSKAKSILCYYDETSFHVSPIAYQEDAPTPEDMWEAQVGLWIQEDVVKAIAELNQEAAEQVADGDACVEYVPVKRLVGLRVLGYEVPKLGRLVFPAASGEVQLAGAGGPSLTGRKCNEQYDVVRFVVQVVIDQRDVLQLIDRISRVNFYQCLGADYEVVDHNIAINQGYFYGTDPVVTATLEFEGYMAREVYEELMPPAIRKLLGIDTEGD